MRKWVTWHGRPPLLVDDIGRGSGLVCLHGLGGGGYFFAGLSESLLHSRRVISFDMPGTGFNSETVDCFSIEACVEATVELIDHISPEPVVLLGHSMGTIIALKAYAKRPDAVNGLIFLGGLPEPVPAIKEKLALRIEKIAEVGMSGIGEETMPGIFSEESLVSHRQLVAMYQRLLEMNPEKSYIDTIRAMGTASAVDEVAKVRVPCLALTGLEDVYASPEDVEAFAEALPVRVDFEVFEACGHVLFFEAPDRFNESINTFLQSLDSDWTFTYGEDEGP